MRLQGGRQSFELFLSFQNVTFFQTKPRSTRANILQLPNPNDPTKTHACFNLEKGPLLSSNKKCILRTPTYISYYVSILFFLLSEHLILVVFNVAARAPLHAHPSIFTVNGSVPPIVAARVPLSPSCGCTGLGDLTIQLYANELSLSLSLSVWYPTNTHGETARGFTRVRKTDLFSTRPFTSNRNLSPAFSR